MAESIESIWHRTKPAIDEALLVLVESEAGWRDRALKAEDLHRPRDTSKGESPEAGQKIRWWNDDQGFWNLDVYVPSPLSQGIWLPAPPPPETDL